MNLLIVGTLAFDSITTPFGKIDHALGGSASYFGLAASQFCKPSIVGVVGEDFTKAEEKILADRNIDTSGIDHQPGQSFAWGGEYSFDLNNRTTLFTHLNVLENFQPQLSDAHTNSEYIFLGNAHPAIQMQVLEQIKNPKLVGLDTMNFWIESAPKELIKILKKVDVFIINDSEARQLSGEHNLVKAAKMILGMMKDSSTLIIKQGEYGLLMFHRDGVFHLPGYPLEDVMDPTGAGDSYAGGFMGWLTKTDDLSFENLKRACVYGSVTASFACEKLGTDRLQNLSADEVAKRYQQFKQLTHFEII